MLKFVYVNVREHFSFAKIIHPPDRCGISISCLNSMIITQVHLVLGQLKATLKCEVLSDNTMPQMSPFFRERAIGMLTTGMSIRAVIRELNVVLENLAVCPNSLTTADHMLPSQPRTSTSGYFTCRIICDQPPGQLMKLISISVCNKALLWGETHSDWLGLAPQWVGLCPSRLCPCPVMWNP